MLPCSSSRIKPQGFKLYQAMLKKGLIFQKISLELEREWHDFT